MAKKLTITIENLTDDQYKDLWEAAKYNTKRMYKFDLPESDNLVFDAEHCLKIDSDMFVKLLGTIMTVHNMQEHPKNKIAKHFL